MLGVALCRIKGGAGATKEPKPTVPAVPVIIIPAVPIAAQPPSVRAVQTP